MKISVILKGKEDGQGRKVVYIRMNEGEKRKFTATKIRVTPDQLQNGKIVKHPQATIFNNVLKRLVAEMENKAATGETDLPEEISFYHFAETELKNWEGIKKPSTITSYTRELAKLKRYKQELTLSDITTAFLDRYRQHLKGLGNSNNTQWKAFKFIKAVLHVAEKKKLVKDNPFELFDGPKFKETKKEYLTREQVDRIEAFSKETPSMELAFCATWFVIGCYTGLRYSDMHAFDEKKNIVGGRLVVHTVKTGEVVGMPISERLKGLFEQVGYKRLHYVNQTYNKRLKTIAALCNIDLPVAAHFSRHTFAMMLANTGISQEVTAKLLGHTNLKTTATYYRISNSRIDDELRRLG
jgi:integrase/recombinase XerD